MYLTCGSMECANPNPGPGGADFMICGPLGKKQVILKGSLYLEEDLYK